jgi:enamine deaminase RidA (YjgF/YER057c/UK114 family)
VAAGAGEFSRGCRRRRWQGLGIYRDSAAQVADGWRATFGSHFPAITMLRVTELAEPQAIVEIEGTATL